MPEGYDSLTDKEKETLRLVVRGHDAKSMARQLSLSVHTINERLRAARRKLAVTSSREAARLVFEHEGAGPNFPVSNHLGEALSGGAVAAANAPDAGAGGKRPLRLVITGAVIMSLILAALGFGLIPAGVGNQPASAERHASTMEAAARSWLEQIDAGDAQGSYARTSTIFREQNSLETWTRVSGSVRTPLGVTRSRTLLSVDTPPTPQGYTIVKFTTQFANRETAMTETVSLVEEDGEWRIAGVYAE